MPRTLDASYPELVEKAQLLFWKKGYKGVSADELAEHLDISKSIIYTKYTKDQFFLDSIEKYVVGLSDPFLHGIRESDKGIEDLRGFFYSVIDGLIDKFFPKSCLMVNTVVELRYENDQVSDIYKRYFGNMKTSYRVVLDRAIQLGEIKETHRLNEYTDFLVGIIFGLSILYKIYSREELYQHIDEQLAMII